MQLVQASESHVLPYASEVAELFWSTGPASYGYQLGGRAMMDALVAASWPLPGTLFGYDGATLAIEDGELVGIEVGFVDPGFEQRVAALGALWPGLLESGAVDLDGMDGVIRRAAQCAWLNPTIPADAYYLHAIAVSEQHQGKGVGGVLMRNALERARQSGARGLQLDVLSDNPAVDFYRAFGLEVAVESTAPLPLAAGVPTEYRMALRFPVEQSAATDRAGDV